jgi:hypothetical protein
MERTVRTGALQRFQSTMDLFFQAVRQQALDRRAGHVPDLESYISLRRDTSGCKPCWALIEYANDLNIPDEVMEHPSLVALGEATNDLVTWSNVSKTFYSFKFGCLAPLCVRFIWHLLTPLVVRLFSSSPLPSTALSSPSRCCRGCGLFALRVEEEGSG